MEQAIVRDTSVKFGNFYRHGEQFVICPVCKQEVSLAISYLDPYNHDYQVHFKCLSEQRKQEINNG